MTEMFYFPQHKMAFAVQTNTSDYRNMKVSALKVLFEIAKTTFAETEKTN